MAEINSNNHIPDFDFPELELDLEKTTTEDVSLEEDSKNIIETKDEEGNKKEEVKEADPKAVAFFEEIKSRGYADEKKEFKGTWEELDEYFDTLPQQILDSLVQSFPPVSKDVMKFIATAGENITKEEMKTFFENYFEESSARELSVDTADDAREFLQNHYKELGLKPKAIDPILDTLEEDGELLEEAKKIFEEKAKNSKLDKIIKDKNEENIALKEKNQERIQKIQEELKTTGWKKEVVTEVTKVLSGNNFNTNLQKIINNPKGLVQLANITRLFNEKTGEFDLSAFSKQADTSTIKSLKERLEEESFSSSGVSTKHRDANPNPSNGMENLELVL